MAKSAHPTPPVPLLVWAPTHYARCARFVRVLTPVNVESAGQYAPEELVPEAIKVMLGKISAVEKGLDKLFSEEA